MASKKIANEKEEVMPSASAFNDEDILHDLLTSLKHLSTSYGKLVQEASHEAFSNEVDGYAKKVGKLARDGFNLMFEKGWYTLEEESKTKLDSEYQICCSKLEEINE